MSLEYNILWVDDDVENLLDPDISSLKNDIEAYLNKLGYIPTIQTFENIKTAKQALFQTNFDLILSDYNMDGGNGDILIKDIRNGNIYTEVLFYTAQTQIEEIAKSLFANRVSFHNLKSDDRNNQELKEKIIWLINQTLKKLQELNAVRGLVMAETSRLDRIIEDILLNHIASEEKIKSHAIKILEDDAKDLFVDKNKRVNERGNLKAQNIENSLLIRRVLDASKRTRVLVKLIEVKQIDIEFSYKGYLKDVIDIRNELAHAKSEIKDGKEVLIVEKGEYIEEKEFNQEDIVRIRKNILKYDKILNNLKSPLKKGVKNEPQRCKGTEKNKV